jgi:hypothetical protein
LGTGSLSGYADGGGALTQNTFNQISGTLAPNLTLKNF